MHHDASSRRARTGALLITVGLLGCSPSPTWDSGSTSHDLGTGEGGTVTGDDEVTVSVDPVVPSVLTLSWEAPSWETPSWEASSTGSAGAGTAWVRYGQDGQLDSSTPQELTEGAGPISVTVLGLKAAHSYSLQAVSQAADGSLWESAVFDVEVAQRDAHLPDLEVGYVDPDGASPGFAIFSTISPEGSWIAVVDRDGDYVWWRESPPGTIVTSVDLAANGSDLLYGAYDVGEQEDVGVIERVPLRGGDVTSTRTLLAHHAFAELPDGRFAWLAFSKQDAVDDPEALPWVGDQILVADEGASDDTEVQVVFDTFADWRSNPEITCSHQELENPVGGLDWTHGNSLVYDEAADAFLYMARHPDSLLSIDATSGEVMWELSPDSAALVDGEETGWSHPHFSQGDQDGLLIFDNGEHHDPAVSWLSEYSRDPGTDTWSRTWTQQDASGRQISLLGDLRRLPSGNLLSAWGSAGMLRELKPDYSEVWALNFGAGHAVGRVQWVEDLYTLDRQP